MNTLWLEKHEVRSLGIRRRYCSGTLILSGNGAMKRGGNPATEEKAQDFH
jgi:hypothetical protein